MNPKSGSLRKPIKLINFEPHGPRSKAEDTNYQCQK